MPSEIHHYIVVECGSDAVEDFPCGETSCNADDDRARFARMPSRGWTVRSVRRAIAAAGWTHTRRYGWLCPYCAKHVNCEKGTTH